jgi:predicted esterase
VTVVGQPLKITEFDEFGHRMFTMNTAKGPLDIAQGITEITPRWTKVEGIRQIWDQRIATSSIPREALSAILNKQIDPQNREHRLKIVRFYLQSERYEDAEQELEAVVKDFPAINEQVTTALKSLRQLMARRVRDEILMRRDSGQHRLAYDLLKRFPERFPATDVAGEILQAVREEHVAYDLKANEAKELLKLLEGQVAALKEADRVRVEPIQQEIVSELNFTNLDRLTSYRQLSTDANLLPEEKVALAISGWLMGSNNGTTNLPVASALYEMRNLARRFLSEPGKLERVHLLDEIRALEGASPQTIARLVEHMKPAFDLPEQTPEESAERPGFYTMQVPGVPEQPFITYSVQLPPEYDPYRRYPTIVTLHGAGTTPEMQIDWWAGSMDTGGRRLGQAARYGYIVIAPHWGRAAQREYGYSAHEHRAALTSIRDACRHFSIDTDRVYLTGHSMGADAAWDIGLAHPDLWAGVMPIVGLSKKVTTYYWENARYVPIYLVMGELDGQSLSANARDLQRYMIRGFDITAVEFLGRGHEHFSDEILNLFEWMGKRRRDFFPKEFECRTMRSFDNFFWPVELAGFPAAVDVDPARWPPRAGTRAMLVRMNVSANNVVRVRSGADRVTVWLSPEMVDFSQPIEVKFNTGRFGGARDEIQPDLGVILDDVRTRGDRQHPFWARVELPAGKINLAAGGG